MATIVDEGIVLGKRKVAWSELRELTLIYYEQQLVRIKFKSDGLTGSTYVGPTGPERDSIVSRVDPRLIREVHISFSGVFLGAFLTLTLLILASVFRALDWLFMTLIVVMYFKLWPVKELVDDKYTGIFLAGGVIVFVAVKLVLRTGWLG